jgi:hypothetical protein
MELIRQALPLRGFLTGHLSRMLLVVLLAHVALFVLVLTVWEYPFL